MPKGGGVGGGNRRGRDGARVEGKERGGINLGAQLDGSIRSAGSRDCTVNITRLLGLDSPPPLRCFEVI